MGTPFKMKGMSFGNSPLKKKKTTLHEKLQSWGERHKAWKAKREADITAKPPKYGPRSKRSIEFSKTKKPGQSRHKWNIANPTPKTSTKITKAKEVINQDVTPKKKIKYGIKTTYRKAYKKADKTKYPTYESFTDAAEKWWKGKEGQKKAYSNPKFRHRKEAKSFKTYEEFKASKSKSGKLEK